PQERIIYMETPTNDTWIRDFGPITVELSDDNTPVVVDFQFNGWGLKFASDKDNLVTSSLSNRHALTGAYENALSFVLEGGSIESDGHGTILTTTRCLMSANRNGGMTREQIAEELRVRLGASHILWLDHGALAGDDTDSHIDTLVRMAPNDTLIYTGCNNPEDEHFEELKRMEDQLRTFTTREGAPYNLVWLPLPDPIYDEDGLRMPATYANYLVTPDAVLMPSYGQPQNDQLAAMILHSVFERKVIAVDCRALVMQHGSLHCATMQIPEAILPV
ncbi:MAG: agmatine deiminase family protein, partial [Paramuribaculum sp.]|nr:agmatine deiminase family protein [Paramuribaculum sp.]